MAALPFACGHRALPAVFLNGTFRGVTYAGRDAAGLLTRDAEGYWAAHESAARAGDKYKFWVDGTGSSGYKRDPYARQLEAAGFPDCFNIVCDATAYPWHDQGFQTPDFSDLVIYQLHIGTYAISRPGYAANFLDVVGKIPYLQALGINMLQPLPVDEQEANPNMGYSGADLFSPDFPYVCSDPALLQGMSRDHQRPAGRQGPGCTDVGRHHASAPHN